MPAGIAYGSSFSCQDGSSGKGTRLRWNSNALMTAPSTGIWRCCVPRLPKSSRAYRMDAVSCSGSLPFLVIDVCKVRLIRFAPAAHSRDEHEAAPQQLSLTACRLGGLLHGR